jgi:CarD family transcriptional regulator
MNFHSGHKVVHKTHGVGEILGIEVLSLGGLEQDYYILRILETGLTVRFPRSSSKGMVRDLVTEEDIGRIYAILRDPPKMHSAIWNRRKKEYSDKIRSGSVFEIAGVLRDLAGRGRMRQPSFGEKELIERARHRLVSEIAMAQTVETDEVERRLDEALSECSRASS